MIRLARPKLPLAGVIEAKPPAAAHIRPAARGLGPDLAVAERPAVWEPLSRPRHDSPRTPRRQLRPSRSPRKASRQSRLSVAAGSYADALRLVTQRRMSFSRPLVCSGISGASCNFPSSAIRPCWHATEPTAIQSDEAGAAVEDAVEPRAQRQTAALAGVGSGRCLKVGVIVPDQLPYTSAVRPRCSVQLVHQPFPHEPNTARVAECRTAQNRRLARRHARKPGARMLPTEPSRRRSTQGLG